MAQDGDEPTKEEVWVWATKVQQKQDETQVLKLLQAGVKSNTPSGPFYKRQFIFRFIQ